MMPPPEGTRASRELTPSGSAPVPLKPRKVLEDENQRDDLKQVIAVLLGVLQRERARADQFYTRARNLLGYATALFTAAQAGLIASVGRERAGEVLITRGELNDVGIPGAVALGLLVISGLMLLAFADRARRMSIVTGDEAIRAWLDPDNEYTDQAVLEVLAAKLSAEATAWEERNGVRGTLNVWLALISGGAVAATLVELAFLYNALV